MTAMKAPTATAAATAAEGPSIESWMDGQLSLVTRLHELLRLRAAALQEPTATGGHAAGAETLRKHMADIVVQVQAVEGLAAQLEAFVDSEAATLEQARTTTLSSLCVQERALAAMLDKLPVAEAAAAVGSVPTAGDDGASPRSQSQSQSPPYVSGYHGQQQSQHTSDDGETDHAAGGMSSHLALQPPQQGDGKPPRSIQLIGPAEFARIPSYIVGRMTCDKINASIADLNQLIADKYVVLKMPQSKMNKIQRSIFWEHKQLATAAGADTKGRVFVTEKDLKDKTGWTVSAFKFDAVGRNVIATLRHLGRIKEVRGGGHTRIVLQ
ncbi:hypothetical protein BC831DRAFT_511077 [Entophlyctis helioformis]|nr:hypothetical protein BC831DRAFT_511077 [Entophlyctis helioformis]